jgi:hypothetical protein
MAAAMRLTIKLAGTDQVLHAHYFPSDCGVTCPVLLDGTLFVTVECGPCPEDDVNHPDYREVF